MKLLLTSAGIRNESIAKALKDLVGKSFSDTKIVFIPTAANRDTDDKGWLIDNILDFKGQNFKSVDIVDIAGLPENIWQPHLLKADIICFGGGDETYLSRIFEEQKMKEFLLPILTTKVYMGISAGSMVAGISLPKGLSKVFFAEEDSESDCWVGMELCDLTFIPHLNSSFFKQVRGKVLDFYKEEFTCKTYATDDETAIKIDGAKIEIVGKGDYWIFNK